MSKTKKPPRKSLARIAAEQRFPYFVRASMSRYDGDDAWLWVYNRFGNSCSFSVISINSTWNSKATWTTTTEDNHQVFFFLNERDAIEAKLTVG